jgi:tetratricopeptide (TPR) repeat protein
MVQMMGRWKVSIVIAVFVAASTRGDADTQASDDNSGFAQLYRSGQSAMAAGKYDEARAVFEKLEKMDTSVAEVHATLGIVCYKLGDFEHAIVEIRAARKLKPNLPGLDALLSLSLAETGKPREALPGLEAAFRSTTDPAVKRQVGMELAQVYSELSMDRRAVELALELRDLYKDDPEVLYNVGKILGNSAYLTMQDLFRSPGAGRSVWVQLAEAEAHESQGQFVDAIQSYRNVLDIDPRRANIHYRIGRTYLTHWKSSHSAEDLSAAEAEFAKELEVDPRNGNAGYELAGLRWKNGDAASAKQLYESVIERYSDFEEALVGLAGVDLDTGNQAEAVSLLERATRLKPEDEVAWYRLAQADRATGNKAGQAKAIEAFTRLHSSTRAAPQRPDANDEITPQQLGADEHAITPQ